MAVVSCGDDYHSNIPFALVDFQINLDIDKELIGGYKVFEKPRNATDKIGYGGLLVIDLLTEYKAYDLACPNEASRAVRIVPNSDRQAVCPKCNSKFDLQNGFVISGTKYNLQQYKVYRNTQNHILRVVN